MASILQSIKISAAVSASTNTNSTLYTAPATGYAIINIAAEAASFTGTIKVGNRQVANYASGVGDQRIPITVYVGPGQAVTTISVSAGTIDISGVEFINTT